MTSGSNEIDNIITLFIFSIEICSDAHKCSNNIEVTTYSSDEKCAV